MSNFKTHSSKTKNLTQQDILWYTREQSFHKKEDFQPTAFCGVGNFKSVFVFVFLFYFASITKIN